MKTFAVTLILALVCTLTTGATAADPPAQPSPEEMAKMMQEWQELMKPGKNHRELDFFVGKWDAKFKMYMAGPKGPTMDSEGTSETKWILGKRYLQSSYKGYMLMPDMKTGQMQKLSYEGLGMMGYDNVRNVFTGSWQDSMGTQMITFKGTMVPGSKTIRMYGEMDEPGLKMFGRLVKYTWKIVDKNSYVFTIFDLAAGEDYKVIEITYTRDLKKKTSKKSATEKKLEKSSK